MKRRLSKVLLFLVLGAIVNVAVAWGCAYFIDQTWKRSTWDPTDQELRDRLSVWRTANPEVVEDHGWFERFDGWGASVEDGTIYDRWKPSRDNRFDLARISCGLPLHCFAGEALRRADAGPVERRHVWLTSKPHWPLPSGFNLGSTLAAERGLIPFRPLAVPFLVNTMFWTGLLWLFGAIFVMGRRSVRMSHGCCPGCGYNLKGTPLDHHVCPECGGTI